MLPTFQLLILWSSSQQVPSEELIKESHNTSFHLKMRHLKSSRVTSLSDQMERKSKLSNIWQKLNPIGQKTNHSNGSRRQFFLCVVPGLLKAHVRVFTDSSPASGCAHSQPMWVASSVTSHCGSGHVFLLWCSSRWCHFLLWVLEKPSGHPWMHLPLPLSCFQCHCARLCIPEREMQTKFAYVKKQCNDLPSFVD